MQRFPIAYLVLILFLTACAPLTAAPPSAEPPAPNSYAPHPADGRLMRSQTFLDSANLLTLESYPLQFSLSLKGNLPTPCHHLRVAVSPPDAENKIVVNVYSVADPNAVCIQMLEPFDVSIPLGSFPSGHYTLIVNGEQIAEFDA